MTRLEILRSSKELVLNWIATLVDERLIWDGDLISNMLIMIMRTPTTTHAEDIYKGHIQFEVWRCCNAIKDEKPGEKCTREELVNTINNVYEICFAEENHESRMGMLSIIYDSPEKIKEYIKDLRTLHEVMDFRQIAGYDLGVRMNSIKILSDRLLLDQCGNTMIKVEHQDDTYSTGRVPRETDVCTCCGEPWSIHNLHDVVCTTKHILNEKASNDDVDSYSTVISFSHKICNFLNKLEKQKLEFVNIFEGIYDLNTLNFKAIPNQYCSCDQCSPWFIVTTPDGDIKIGWRKRVINISWMESYSNFSENYDDENVTKGFSEYNPKRYIHAWDIEKCKEYLKLAKESIIVTGGDNV